MSEHWILDYLNAGDCRFPLVDMCQGMDAGCFLLCCLYPMIVHLPLLAVSVIAGLALKIASLFM